MEPLLPWNKSMWFANWKTSPRSPQQKFSQRSPWRQHEEISSDMRIYRNTKPYLRLFQTKITMQKKKTPNLPGFKKPTNASETAYFVPVAQRVEERRKKYGMENGQLIGHYRTSFVKTHWTTRMRNTMSRVIRKRWWYGNAAIYYIFVYFGILYSVRLAAGIMVLFIRHLFLEHHILLAHFYWRTYSVFLRVDPI